MDICKYALSKQHEASWSSPMLERSSSKLEEEDGHRGIQEDEPQFEETRHSTDCEELKQPHEDCLAIAPAGVAPDRDRRDWRR